MLHFDSTHPIVTRGSRAPPHHALPAFLNLHVINIDHFYEIILCLSETLEKAVLVPLQINVLLYQIKILMVIVVRHRSSMIVLLSNIILSYLFFMIKMSVFELQKGMLMSPGFLLS